MKYITLFIVVFFAVSCTKNKNVEKEFYSISQDPYLLGLEKKFRENPEEGMSCEKSVCESPILNKRDNYLKDNCLVLDGHWSYSDSETHYTVTISRRYYKKSKEDCSK